MLEQPSSGALDGKRLLLFLPHVADGGAERVLVHLATHWARQGIAVHLLVARPLARTAPSIPAAIRLTEGGVASTPRFLPRLVRAMMTLRPDAVLAALPHGNVVASAAHALARSRSRLVLSDHAVLEPNGAARRGSAARWLERARRAAYLRADAVVGVSNGVASDLRRAYRLDAARVHAINNPVLLPDFVARGSAPLPPAFAWEPPGAPRALRLLAVGRLAPEKDIATCLRAFAAVRLRCPARLTVLGEGVERPMLERLARELGVERDVTWLGFVENPLPFMRTADVLVHTARSEGLGNVLVEALACGARVVATDCPYGPREVVQQLGRGRLVPVGDARAVASAIAQALEEAAPAPPSEAALACYTVADVARRYAALLFGAEP